MDLWNSRGVDGTPQLSASFSLALFGAVFSITCSHKEAQHRPSSTQPPLRHPVAPGERELYAGAPGFMSGNQKPQVMETAGLVGWLWPRGSGKVVSGPSGLHRHFLLLQPFTLLLPSFYPSLPSSTAPAFLPESLQSSNRKQMSSSKSEVTVLCPSSQQGNTSEMHFHIVGP